MSYLEQHGRRLIQQKIFFDSVKIAQKVIYDAGSYTVELLVTPLIPNLF